MREAAKKELTCGTQQAYKVPMAKRKVKMAKKKTGKRPVKKVTQKALEYVIVRCSRAGVHAGMLASVGKDFVVLHQARRLWYWNGAATLSELAVHGLNPAKSSSSKFSVRVPEQRLAREDVCEIIVCQPAGRASIEGVPEWRA